MDYGALHAELQKADYTGLSHVEAAALGNTADQPGTRAVPAGDVIRALTLRGKWPAIVLASRRPPTDTAADATILAAINMVEATTHFPSFDLQDATYLAAITAGLDALIAAGLIDASDKAAVLALENVLVSRFDLIGCGGATWDDVRRARERG